MKESINKGKFQNIKDKLEKKNVHAVVRMMMIIINGGNAFKSRK